MPPQILFKPQITEEKPQLRFAEDILAPKPIKATAKTSKSKKKKKGAHGKESAEDGIKLRKTRRQFDIEEDEEY